MFLRFSLLIIIVLAPNVEGAEQARKRVVVIAHRGVHHELPENSLAAIRKAAELPCDFVEVDVRTTRDGELVLMHDSTVDRTTNGTGPVADMTLAEIRQLRFGAKWPDERVPTFDEALSACRGRIKVYIDHKNASPAAVLAVVKKHKMLADVIVYGSVETLREYKKLNPNVWIMPPHPGGAEEIKKLVAELKPETLDGNIRDWEPEHAKAAHEAGAQIWVDVANIHDKEFGLRRAIELDVDAIQTDHPQRLIERLKTQGLR